MRGTVFTKETEITHETEKGRFIVLRAQGYSFDKIARELGRSRQTLVNWDRSFKEEIANLRAVELESLYERYFLTKEHKIKLFGDLVSRIKAEFDHRDLGDIPTDRLLDLFGKFYALLEAERIEIQPKTSAEITCAKDERETLNRLLGISDASETGDAF